MFLFQRLSVTLRRFNAIPTDRLFNSNKIPELLSLDIPAGFIFFSGFNPGLSTLNDKVIIIINVFYFCDSSSLASDVFGSLGLLITD